LFVADGLHPAAGVYHFWAEKLTALILQLLREDHQ
jgi:hypothetical protein